MASDPEYADQVTARLFPLGPVTWRRMFGGFGIYLDGLMFGLIAYDKLYFKVDAENRAEYEEAGCGPFTYEGKRKPVQLSYWLVPDDVYDDIDTLSGWAERAHQAAKRNKAKHGPKRERRPRRPKQA